MISGKTGTSKAIDSCVHDLYIFSMTNRKHNDKVKYRFVLVILHSFNLADTCDVQAP